jgi:hypothetical protein
MREVYTALVLTLAVSVFGAQERPKADVRIERELVGSGFRKEMVTHVWTDENC